MASSQLAYRIKDRLSHQNLERRTEAVPAIRDHEVLVEVRGVTLDNVKVGDRVIANFALNNPYGTLKNQDQTLGGGVDGMLRQYAAVPAHAIVKIPEQCELDFVQLASLVCTGATVWNALFGYKPMRPGQTVLFQGVFDLDLDLDFVR
jgi:NADPH:quinone reductase-like Zn-dependent oxidoreductase